MALSISKIRLVYCLATMSGDNEGVEALAYGVDSLALNPAKEERRFSGGPTAGVGAGFSSEDQTVSRTASVNSNLSAYGARPPPNLFPYGMPNPGFRPGAPPPGFLPPGVTPANGAPPLGLPPFMIRPGLAPGASPPFMRPPPMMGPNGAWLPPPGMIPPPGMMHLSGMTPGRPPMIPGPPPHWMMNRPPPFGFQPPSGMMPRQESMDGQVGERRHIDAYSVHSNDGEEDAASLRISTASNGQNFDAGASEAESISDGVQMRPPPPMMFGGPNMPLMMPYEYNPMMRPPGPLGAFPPPPPMGAMVMPPNGSRPLSMDMAPPNMERTDSDNSSIRSTGTGAASRANTGALPFGDNLEVYRQNAKKSNDPAVQLDFAKFLIATGDAALDSDPDPKKAKKNQDILYAEGLKWVKKLAAAASSRGQAHPEAMFYLAECYGNGSIGLTVDHDRAFTLYVQASKQNHPSATYRAAVCYEVGAGTKRDYARSVQFYRKSAALGETAAMYKLGMILLNGLLNQPRNPREGVTWLKRAGSQADETTPHALHELAALYEGKGETNGIVIPDPAYAHDLYRRGAQLGYSPSQYKLGVCYEYGLLDLPIDPRRSIAWYTRSAEQGDPEAELALSGWYLTGADGVLKQSDTEAYLWARKAADKGLAKAEYAVGYYSEHGVGVKGEVDEARKWYMRAASQNNKRAVQRLKELKSLAGVAQEKSRSGNWRREKANANTDGDCSIM